MDKRRIGIFGGSFDPIHSGHIGLAQDAKAQVQLEKVIFVPAKLQPFKLDKTMVSGEHRVNMIRLALKETPGYEISTYELDAEEISYTFLTMRAMAERFGENARLYFITGTDAFLKIEKWKNATELLSNYSYIIGTRPGYQEEPLQTCIDRIRHAYNTEVRLIDNVQIDVSSTEIRSLLETGTLRQGLIPAETERYIQEHALYRS